ncbi:N-acetylmuramoyl-L-alanine amidase [Azotobacter vinelandii CA]|uniref:N-acetylmuramoyl-L-alanine amidase AmiC n=2 Tax=Azotobacter vinelandii TaxID=354 RepID=C1DM04_AZOVD|nr:N-acetylmuramoyl-L-alanine amidase [Azotobacter vinelandii]ACO79091.1 N-acetylmuramoyl-L-alanine amidase [Azotobacter vinelandii DJ]AGK14817.1 N-acetylmuramoyl-L-alanine amidase [Azotobacter vinelandii CA]AGK20960.1 N-acetylmuramoyl-L-alanine amidase [Azotobacter vinelandii CA6]WKN20070.1 N-acetylmuramoyl-L-alanine amidase [Azotobacter vinelandii]SFX51119.1 N-acetylmuramoyl-L-alanine amidase [Azotobacter vinelandii]
MHRRRLLKLLLAGLALPFPATAHPARQLVGIRSWRSSGKLRVVLDLSGPVEHRTFELAAPRRLIVDLDDTRLNTSLAGLPLAQGPIRSLRSGLQGAGTRLVFDLNEPVLVNSFLLAPGEGRGHRLVLDFQLRTPPVQAAVIARPAAIGDGQRNIVVVIDAGHGGKDPGAVGPKGEQEKAVALAIARLLAKKVDGRSGFKARLVRNEDVFIPLRKRVEVARRYNADMFISIHADAAPRRTASGASVFALSQGGATSTMARWLAERENRVDLLGAQRSLSLKDRDPMLAGVILDMSMTATITTSLDLGKNILDSLQGVAGAHQKRVEQAGFAVLKSPDIPSVLVETGFMSNTVDCRKLVDPRHQRKVANAIFDGLFQHFQARPPQGTLLAKMKESQDA